jgi:hypothetical protein
MQGSKNSLTILFVLVQCGLAVAFGKSRVAL